MSIRFGILTVSDRSAAGERADSSGPALVKAIEEKGWRIKKTEIVPDDYSQLVEILKNWSDSNELDVILSTGGTGFSPRDITPEATTAIIHRNTPGLSEVMRSESHKITPHAMLSRAVAGIRNSTLIVNLPGSPKAAVENFNILQQVIPHAVDLLREEPQAEAGHQFAE